MASTRLTLLIGNQEYSEAVGPRHNPQKDIQVGDLRRNSRAGGRSPGLGMLAYGSRSAHAALYGFGV